MKWLLIPIALYLAVVTLVFLGQRSLLYLPGGRAATTEALDALRARRWPEAESYRGYLFDDPAAEATVVVFHGNAGDAIDRVYYVQALGFLNARVLLAEYPGYGARPGSPSEETLVADARGTLARVRAAFSGEPLHVVGESLGAAVAAGAIGHDGSAAARTRVDGLILLTPWRTLTEVAAHHYRFLPVRWLLRDRYPSAERLASFAAPKIVVVAERDEIVPARYGTALFEALPEPKRLVVVAGARHNDWLERVDRAWWRDLWEPLRPPRASR